MSNPRLVGAAVAGVVVALAAGHVATAAGTAAAARDAAQRLEAAGAPSAVVLIRDGAVPALGASGSETVPGGPPVTPGHRFRVGSVTKTFTATLVLQLVGEGRLSLGDTLARRLPGVVPGGDRITIRRLLQHTSGIPDYLNDPVAGARVLARLQADPERAWTSRELVGIALSRPRTGAPGAAWSYSNTNYVLAGMVVERVTGRRLGRVLRDRIIRPLGLTATALPDGPGIAGRHAHGHLAAGAAAPGTPLRDVTRLSPTVAGGAGGLVSSARDLDTFLRALLGGRLLRPAQLREMTRTVPMPDGNGYGLGLIRIPGPCGPMWGHDGAIFGYSSLALAGPGGRRAYVRLEGWSDASASAARTTARVDLAALAAACGRR